MKTYLMRLRVFKNKAGFKVETTYNTGICLGDKSNLMDVLDFQNNAKKIWKKAMKAVKEKNQMQLSIEASAYDGLDQISLDRWVSIPVEEQDNEGIYLKADKTFTDPEMDMYLGKDVLRDLEDTVGRVE